jgi:hypothetical protein
VVVLKLKDSEEPASSDSYENSELVTYAEARKSTNRKPYITAVVASSGVDGTSRHPEDANQPRVIIIMVLWSLALVTLFFKGLYSMTRYGMLLVITLWKLISLV